MNLKNAKFLLSAGALTGVPADGLPQVVFSGRSNVGKSSVINRLTGQKNLARVGASPGKTTNINFFFIDETFYLVDLPGYGYAKVSKSERARWAKLLDSYFEMRSFITLGVMIVDARHKPTQDDCAMARWFVASGKPFIVVANKLDKVRKKSEIPANLDLIRDTLQISDDIRIIGFSAEKGTGLIELTSEILAVI